MSRSRFTSAASVQSSAWDTMRMIAEEDEQLNEAMKHQTFHEAAREGNLDVVEGYLKTMHESLEEMLDYTVYKKKLLNLRINARDAHDMTALHYAAQNNHVEICKLLIKYSTVSSKRKGPDPISHITMFMSDLNDLSDSQLDVMAKNKDGATALHLAACGSKSVVFFPEKKNFQETTIEDMLNELQKQHETTIKTILDWCKATVVETVKDAEGWTPLHWACKHDNVDAAMKLLMFQPKTEHYCKWKSLETSAGIGHYFAKSNIELLKTQDNHGMTPLHVCASNNAVFTAKLLLGLEADLIASDARGWTPMHHAAAEGDLEMCKLLEESASQKGQLNTMLSVMDKSKHTCLHVATEKNYTAVVRFLLDKGSSTLAARVDSKGKSVMHIAAQLGNIEIMKMLADESLSINVATNSGLLPIHFAAKNNHLHVLQHLLEQGEHCDPKDKNGRTPLMLACLRGNAKIATFLLDNGADALNIDSEEMTGLHWACARNKVEVVKLLLTRPEAKTICGMRNKEKKQPLHLAATHGHHKVVEALLEADVCEICNKDSSERSPIHHAAAHGNAKVVKLILRKYPPQIHAKCEMGNTPLIIAALAGKEQVIKCLISFEAPLDTRNSRSQSALTCCAMKDYTKCAKLLLEANAKVNDFEKLITPLHAACTYGSNNMVKLLLKYGAAVSYRDECNNTPLDLAIKHGHKSCVQSIIESDKWKAAIRSANINLEHETISTPLRQMIKSMPDMAQLVFSRCTVESPNISVEDLEYNILFNFEFLDDAYSIHAWEALQTGGEHSVMCSNAPCFEVDGLLNAASKPYTTQVDMLRKNHPLALVVKSGNSYLLSHPLIKVLLKYKWKRYGRRIYYVLLFLYLIYLAALTSYLLTLPPPYAVQIQGKGQNACFVPEVNARSIWKPELCECCQYGSAQNGFVLCLNIVIGVLATLSLVKEGFQLWSKKLRYFRELDNYVELISYILSLIVIIDWSEKARVTGVKEYWQWQVAAFCLLTSWLTLALFVRKLPTLGIYVIMLLDIMHTFAKFFVTFLLFILAFGLFFFMMLQNQATFQTVWESLLKTSVMMIGELDYTTMFYSDDETQNVTNSSFTGSDSNDTVTIHYRELTTIVYIIFLIFMPIVTMNVLVGLAVDDIKSVQEQATQQKMGLQVNLALDVEFLIPEMIRKHLTVGNYRMYPNKYKERNKLVRFLFEDQEFRTDAIAKLLQSEKETKDLFIEQTSHICQSSHDIKKKLDILVQQNKHLSESLALLSQYMKEKVQ